MAIHTDEQAEAQKAKKIEWARLQRIKIARASAVSILYSTSDGRDYLRWLLQVGHAIGENPFRGDPHSTAFCCGEQNVGQQIMAHMIETDPLLFAELLKEANSHGPRSPSNAGDAGSDASDTSDAGDNSGSDPGGYT